MHSLQSCSHRGLFDVGAGSDALVSTRSQGKEASRTRMSLQVEKRSGLFETCYTIWWIMHRECYLPFYIC